MVTHLMLCPIVVDNLDTVEWHEVSVSLIKKPRSDTIILQLFSNISTTCDFNY